MESRIVIDPEICNGRPTIAGTRITAQTVLEFLGAGDTVEELLENYSSLTKQDVLACINFSSKLMANSYSTTNVA